MKVVLFFSLRTSKLFEIGRMLNSFGIDFKNTSYCNIESTEEFDTIYTLTGSCVERDLSSNSKK